VGNGLGRLAQRRGLLRGVRRIGLPPFLECTGSEPGAISPVLHHTNVTGEGVWSAWSAPAISTYSTKDCCANSRRLRLDQRDGGFEKWMVRVGPTDRSAQCVAAVAKSQDLLLYNHEIDFQKGRQTVKRGHHEIAGVLWKSVLLCCAFPCSGVDLQRTSRELGC
jgi:hypothetical protein